MAKIAGRDYPGDLGVDEAEKWMKILVREYDGVTDKKEAFAQDVGHKSTKSGTFLRKIADARKYAILAPRGAYEVTDLGLQLAEPPDDRTRLETKYEMLQNIPLLGELDEVLDGYEHEGQFWKELADRTDADPEEAKKAANRIEKLYQEIIKLKRTLSTEEFQEIEKANDLNEVEKIKENSKDDENGISGEGIFLRVGDDEFHFSELSDMNIQLAQRILESKKGDGAQSDLRMWSKS